MNRWRFHIIIKNISINIKNYSFPVSTDCLKCLYLQVFVLKCIKSLIMIEFVSFTGINMNITRLINEFYKYKMVSLVLSWKIKISDDRKVGRQFSSYEVVLLVNHTRCNSWIWIIRSHRLLKYLRIGSFAKNFIQNIIIYTIDMSRHVGASYIFLFENVVHPTFIYTLWYVNYLVSVLHVLQKVE